MRTLVVLFAVSLHAGTILSNLPLAATTASSGFSSTGGTLGYAFGFTPQTTATLDNVMVALRLLPGSLPGGDPYSFALYETTPLSGTPLTSLQLPATVATSAATYTLLPTSPTVLNGGTTYWLLFTITGTTANGGVRWLGNLTTPTGTATPADNTYVITDTTVFSNNTSATFGYAINATTTPEPGTIILLSIGILSLYAVRRTHVR